MKYLIIIIISLFSFSCSNPELQTAEAKQKELNCKYELTKEISENGINILALLSTSGHKKEVDAFYKAEKDTTISCDSLRAAWNNIVDLSDKGFK